jgi:hypothetical protein
MLGHTLNPAASRLAQFIVSFSTGYFLYDSIDMLISRIYLNSAGTWIHHILVIGSFMASIYNDTHGVYLVFNLIVELNNIFIHQRKLSTLTGMPQNWLFNVNSKLMFISFWIARFGGNSYIFFKIISDYELFMIHSNGLMNYAIACFGMFLLNIYNVVFYLDLIKSEKRLKEEAQKHKKLM